MTSNMKSKTFWREYDDLNDAIGVKQVIVGAKGDYIILGWFCIFFLKNVINFELDIIKCQNVNKFSDFLFWFFSTQNVTRSYFKPSWQSYKASKLMGGIPPCNVGLKFEHKDKL